MRWRRKTLRRVLLLSTLSVVVCFILFLKLRLSPLVKELALARVENKASNLQSDRYQISKERSIFQKKRRGNGLYS